MLNIDLKNYILFKRKFIIFDKNENAHEFDFFNGKLLFVGEYLNGERHRKGKEFSYSDDEKNSIKEEQYSIPEKFKYNNLSILFKGEYLNGERNGKGKEYDNGIFLFEGEYLKGKKWNGNYKGYKLKNGKGIIREYYDNELVFKGEYLNEERNGKGNEYDKGEALIFDGEYINGKRWKGKGKEYFLNGKLKFEGEYLNGEKNGKGKEYNKYGELIFDGNYLNGKKLTN